MLLRVNTATELLKAKGSVAALAILMTCNLCEFKGQNFPDVGPRNQTCPWNGIKLGGSVPSQMSSVLSCGSMRFRHEYIDWHATSTNWDTSNVKDCSTQTPDIMKLLVSSTCNKGLDSHARLKNLISQRRMS